MNPDIVWFQGTKDAYKYVEILKAQGRKVYVANHPSNHFGCEINGEKLNLQDTEIYPVCTSIVN